MAGRIRTIKPEWLEDEKIAAASLEARLLSVALLLIADDHGRGRAQAVRVGAEVFPNEANATETARAALAELANIGYISLYSVRDQSYFAIVNWKKHQRVDRPGAPRVPAPEDADRPPQSAMPKSVYFMRGRTTGLIKIGESVDPVARLAELAKGGSEGIDLLAIVANGSRTERELHAMLMADRVHGEWFQPSPAVMAALSEAGGDVTRPIATAGYDGRNRVLDSVATTTRSNREADATDPDLRSPISDHDQRPSTTTPATATPDKVPLTEVIPQSPPKSGPLVEVWHMLEPRGFSRDVVTSCLHRWHGPKETLPLAIAYVLAHLPADARAGLVIDACSKADPVLVADWDRAGRPPRTSPKPPPERQTGGKMPVYVEPPPQLTPDQRRAHAKAVADAARAIGMGGRPFAPPKAQGDPVAGAGGAVPEATDAGGMP